MEDSENKANKNLVPIKLSDELRRELRREANARFERGEPEPTFNDLLSEAWRVYKKWLERATPELGKTQGNSLGKISESNRADQHKRALEFGTSNIPVTEADVPWVAKLLRVLHSSKPGLPVAIKTNMEEFEWAADAWDELQQRRAAPVPESRTGAGGVGEAPPPVQSITGVTGHGHTDEPTQAGNSKRLSEIEADLQRSKAPKKRSPRKTG